MTAYADQAEAVFFAALDRAQPGDRTAFVEGACGADSELLRRVRELLAAHDESHGPLDSPPPGLDDAVDPPHIGERPGTIIGPYKLLEQIGEGGFGVVFMAEQRHPVRRLVALKVLKPGMDTSQVVARFEAERQALALMDHPNIARVFDGGETAGGRPYFVMELVRGIPLTEFCDQNHQSVRERLELFTSICQAIQHAHQKGIIHRDLKPTNVLVTLQDGKPVAKVIDFGIAKATGQRLTDKTLFTNFAQMVGTPMYMSPEQAQLSAQDVDTRSDIYSLGVLLYELLTGSTPFDQERLRTESFDEIRRIIREEEPARPSLRMSTLGQAAATVSANRQCDPRRLRLVLQGELDWIVMKALDKDRNRRYESASAFAADVQRYLDDEPVQACPPSAVYRLGKFARRNRGALVTTTALLTVLVAGAGVAGWQAVVATRAAAGEKRAKEIAEVREAETRAVLDFVQSKVFSAARPKRQYGGIGREVTLREAMKAALPSVDKSFTNEPLIEARLRATLGLSFYLLGESAMADEQYQRARVLFERHLGREHPDTLHSLVLLANGREALGHYAEALQLREVTLALQTRVFGATAPETLSTMNNLANSLADVGRGPEALRLRERTLALRKDVLGSDHVDTVESMHSLAISYHADSRHDEALELRQKVMAARRTSHGADHPTTLGAMTNLANTLTALDRGAEALKLHQEALALKKVALGLDHPDTLLSMTNLANCHSTLKQHDEALRLREETLGLMQQVHELDHPETLRAMQNLAASYHNVRLHDEALKLRQETWALRKRKLGPDHPDTLNTMRSVAESLIALKRGAEAVTVIDECLVFANGRIDPPRLVPSLVNMKLRQFEKANDAQRCRETANQWERLGRTDGESLFVAGLIWAVTARVSHEDKDADRAMEWLRRAAAAGCRDTERLNKSPDFSTLRERPDFKSLLSEEKPDKPAG